MSSLLSMRDVLPGVLVGWLASRVLQRQSGTPAQLLLCILFLHSFAPCSAIHPAVNIRPFARSGAERDLVLTQAAAAAALDAAAYSPTGMWNTAQYAEELANEARYALAAHCTHLLASQLHTSHHLSRSRTRARSSSRRATRGSRTAAMRLCAAALLTRIRVRRSEPWLWAFGKTLPTSCLRRSRRLSWRRRSPSALRRWSPWPSPTQSSANRPSPRSPSTPALAAAAWPRCFLFLFSDCTCECT